MGQLAEALLYPAGGRGKRATPPGREGASSTPPPAGPARRPAAPGPAGDSRRGCAVRHGVTVPSVTGAAPPRWLTGQLGEHPAQPPGGRLGHVEVDRRLQLGDDRAAAGRLVQRAQREGQPPGAVSGRIRCSARRRASSRAASGCTTSHRMRVRPVSLIGAPRCKPRLPVRPPCPSPDPTAGGPGAIRRPGAAPRPVRPRSARRPR